MPERVATAMAVLATPLATFAAIAANSAYKTEHTFHSRAIACALNPCQVSRAFAAKHENLLSMKFLP